MRRLVLTTCVVVGACDGPATIDEACPARVPGENLLKGEPSDLVLRIGCYRRFVGLKPLNIQQGVQQAVALHAQYLEENGVLDPASENYHPDPFGENPNLPFFTGANVFDRLEASQGIDVTADLQVWQVNLPRDEVDDDAFFDLPWVRDPMFEPLLVGGGYAEFDAAGQTMLHMNLVFTFPPNARVDNPVVYPRDGQVDVPIGWVAPRWWDPSDDPILNGGGQGYPITITVGSWEGDASLANPYGLTAMTQRLVDEDGTELPLVSAGPGRRSFGDNLATLIYAATQPLRPGTTYTFEAEISWNAKPSKTVVTTFTTASSGDVDTL